MNDSIASMATDTFIDFKCPACHGPVSFPADYLSAVQECPNCSESLIIPAAASEFGLPIPIPITTPRLILRRLGTADWADLLEFLGDEETYRFMEGRPQEEADILRWLEADAHVRLTTPDTVLSLGIVLRERDKVIGHLYLNPRDHLRQAWFGLVISRPYQRQGFATEAVEGLLEFCFRDLRLHRIEAGCDSRNVAARRVFEKAGLRQEGDFLKNNFRDGEWTSNVGYAMLDEEYGQKQTPPRRNE